jgi:hypothetical protein
MESITYNLKENKKDLMLIVAIQSMVAIGCYFMVPVLLN